MKKDVDLKLAVANKKKYIWFYSKQLPMEKDVDLKM